MGFAPCGPYNDTFLGHLRLVVGKSATFVSRFARRLSSVLSSAQLTGITFSNTTFNFNQHPHRHVKNGGEREE